MKVTGLTIENFLTIGNANLKLADKGLVLIQGENKDDASADSNGSGKSSIPDALCWGLYGETARGEKGDAVVNNKVKKNTMVGVTIEDGEDTYLITRYRKHKDFKNRLMVMVNGVDKTKGTDKLTQDFIVELLGCSLEVFQAAVYAGQEAMPDLPGMTDKQLKVLVEEAAGTDKLQKAHEIAKAKLRDRQNEVDELNRTLAIALREKVGTEDQINTLQSSTEQWEESRLEKIELTKSQAREKVEESKREDAKVDRVAYEALNKELEGVREKLAAVDEERKQRDILATEANDAATSFRVILSQVETAKKQLERANESVEMVDHKVGQACGECGKEHTEEDVKSLREIATQKVQEAKKNLMGLVSKAKECREASESAQEALNSFQASMTDVSAAVEREREINVSLKEFDTYLINAQRAKKEAETLVERISALKIEVSPYGDLINAQIEKGKSLDVKIQEVEKQIEEAEKLKSIAQDAVSVFGPAGVRAHILDMVTPFLNERTSHYLGTLSDGNITAEWSTLATTTKGELREKFNIEVSNDKGAKSFKGLSGGEKRKVRLSAAMALQDMVASRAAKPIELFIADEVDHALDEAGLERLMSVLNEKATERGTVLVISHNELSDWIRDQSTVIKEGGVSTVVGALAA